MSARTLLFDADGRAAAVPQPEAPHMVEVVRSVSFKLNLGNYQSMDFFCSQKSQCAADEVDQVSADLYDWCYDQVMASVKDVKDKQARKQAAIERTSAA
jgi:hypothetical protein